MKIKNLKTEFYHEYHSQIIDIKESILKKCLQELIKIGFIPVDAWIDFGFDSIFNCNDYIICKKDGYGLLIHFGGNSIKINCVEFRSFETLSKNFEKRKIDIVNNSNSAYFDITSFGWENHMGILRKKSKYTEIIKFSNVPYLKHVDVQSLMRSYKINTILKDDNYDKI